MVRRKMNWHAWQDNIGWYQFTMWYNSELKIGLLTTVEKKQDRASSSSLQTTDGTNRDGVVVPAAVGSAGARAKKMTTWSDVFDGGSVDLQGFSRRGRRPWWRRGLYTYVVAGLGLLLPCTLCPAVAAGDGGDERTALSGLGRTRRFYDSWRRTRWSRRCAWMRVSH